MVAVHNNHLCSPLRIIKPILICLYFLCFSSGYNAWRDRTKPSHILAKMCSDAGFGAPHYRLHQGKVTVNKKDFYLSDGRFTHTSFSLLTGSRGFACPVFWMGNSKLAQNSSLIAKVKFNILVF